MSDVNSFHKAIGSFKYSVDTATPVAITTSVGGVSATKAFISVLNDDIRFTYHGVNPTPTDGHFIGNYLSQTVFGHANLDRFRMIAVNGVAEVTVTIEAPED